MLTIKMMENLICTIGKKTDDISDESTFTYNNDLYKKLMIWQDFEQLIGKIVKIKIQFK